MEKTGGDRVVAQAQIKPQLIKENQKKKPPFKWTTVSIQEVVKKDYRLEASVYGIEGRQVRKDLKKCKWDIVLFGDEFIENAFYLGRFKRIYVDKTNGIQFILPSQITEIYPKANKYISPETNIDIKSTRVKKGQILLTRSGTIGVVSYVSKTLKGQSLSDDVIRIETKEYAGYIYAFLKSRMGRLLVETNNYGAVISHIEPEHLNNIPIPNPPAILKQQIHDLIEQSFQLRDESNDLLDEAQALLKKALQLPEIEKLQAKMKQFDKKADVLNYSLPLSELNNRLDGSYHVPIVKAIERHINKTAKEILKIGDRQISQAVILPGRFKRIYVEEGSGITFFGGKQLFELDPSNKKYLSLIHHGDRIKNQLTLHENMTMITCSGTIGKVTIVPKHWDGWTANQHIIRVIPANDYIAGYLYAWLSSDYAYPLIIRQTYGAVVDEINDKQVSEIFIPLLQDTNAQKTINDTVLRANKKRARAYELEQEALQILNDKVIYAV
ncbi:MAG: restriction endonuclease subunit S [Bacteroidales bacterium]|nr:restriction endonuclease subunit S [Bacteroidales bacterium]